MGEWFLTLKGIQCHNVQAVTTIIANKEYIEVMYKYGVTNKWQAEKAGEPIRKV
jgi:hypothetical protein